MPWKVLFIKSPFLRYFVSDFRFECSIDYILTIVRIIFFLSFFWPFQWLIFTSFSVGVGRSGIYVVLDAIWNAIEQDTKVSNIWSNIKTLKHLLLGFYGKDFPICPFKRRGREVSLSFHFWISLWTFRWTLRRWFSKQKNNANSLYKLR